MSDDAERTASVVDPDAAPTREMRLGRGYAIQLVDPALGSEQLDFHMNVLKAGAPPGPYHLHTNCENIYYILQGNVVVTIDGTKHEMRPGMAVFIPPGVPHSATNVGDTEARLLEIYTPPGQDFVVLE